MSSPVAASGHAASPRRIPLLEAVVIVAALFLGKEFFLPVALSVLISFLLAPVARGFERMHLRRVPAVIATSIIAFILIGMIGYIMAGQVIDLANKLPEYKNNLRAKIISLKTPKDGPLNRATRTLRDLTSEIMGTAPPTGSEPQPKASQPSLPDPAAAEKNPAGDSESQARPGAKKPVAPVPVEVVHSPVSALQALAGFLSPVAAPVGMAAIVIVLVIFMLIEREDLRDRLVYIAGPSRVHVMTQALDEAGERVSRYILAQATVNFIYGIAIGTGLTFIGIPNAVLWGMLATVLRFIPYVGAWIAAAFPMLVSLAFPGWKSPMLVLGLFILVEVVTYSVVEPWFYGARTGLTAFAVILSAIFWGWLWGAAGLLLAMPLTVCIAVLGRYLPDFAILELLISDKPSISTGDRFYQRLAALDAEAVSSICEEHCAKNSLAATFDDVIIPALRQMAADRRRGVIAEPADREMHQLVREVINDLADSQMIAPGAANHAVQGSILCLPASNESDELAALMLLELLRHAGALCEMVNAKSLAAEMIEEALKLSPKIVCVSCVPPASEMPARYLCRRLHERFDGGSRIVAGLWGEDAGDGTGRVARFKRAQADEVFQSLGAAAREILLQVGVVTALPEAPEAPPEAQKGR